MTIKFPSPAIAITAALCIYFSRGYFPGYDIVGSLYLGYLLELIGLAIIVVAIMSFNRRNTTANPIKPGDATALVTDGLYKYSRNPMYVGLAIMLIGFSVQVNPLGGLVFVPLFVLAMTVLQILPEEKILPTVFGEEYAEYKSKVRRWL